MMNLVYMECLENCTTSFKGLIHFNIQQIEIKSKMKKPLSSYIFPSITKTTMKIQQNKMTPLHVASN